jgi:hypothetical protein
MPAAERHSERIPVGRAANAPRSGPPSEGVPPPRPRRDVQEPGASFPSSRGEGSNPFRRSVERNGITDVFESHLAAPSAVASSRVCPVFFEGGISDSLRICAPR